MARRGYGAADWWSYALSRPWLYIVVALVLFGAGLYFGWQALLANRGADSDLVFGYLGIALGLFSIAIPYAANPGSADREYQAKHDALDAAERALQEANLASALASGYSPTPPQMRPWVRWFLYRRPGR